MALIMSIFSLWLLLLPHALSVPDVRVEVPTYAIRRSDVLMKCLYGNDTKLISKLVWYKDGNQFYKYESSQTSFKKQDSAIIFEISSLEKGHFYLKNVSFKASGHYHCEVSSGTENLTTKSEGVSLTIIDLPVDAAEVNVKKSSYFVGEDIEANCSTRLNQPLEEVFIEWKINKQLITEKTNSSQLLNYPTKELTNGTNYYVRGIKFTPQRSRGRIITLECQTSIPGIFQKSSVVSIQQRNQDFTPFTRASRVRRELAVNVEIPAYKELGSTAELKCLYSLQGSSLYSVKWYKGTKHFYQFIPAKQKPKYFFSTPYLQVDLEASNEGHVVLRNLSMDATGQYKCEVITEAPQFFTKFGQGNMTVIDLPESAPVLSGLKNSYQLGEEVHVNCSSLSSKPAASLQWQINDNIVDNSHWLIQYPITYDSKNLETAVLGLQFIAMRDHFSAGTMRLKCKAQIGNLYYQSQENVVLHTNFLERKQESHGYYVPSFFYNSSKGSSCSSLVFLSFSILMHRMIL